MGFLTYSLVYSAEDANVTFGQLKAELEKKGIALQELTNVEKPVKEMLKQGATKNDLKKVLLDLTGKGIIGTDLQSAVNSMNDLVKSGETPKQAGNIVSLAAHQAKAQGLKGKELAAKVHEAVRQRKAEMEQLKRQMQQKQKETQGKGEKMKKDTEKGTQIQQKQMKKTMQGKMGK